MLHQAANIVMRQKLGLQTADHHRKGHKACHHGAHRASVHADSQDESELNVSSEHLDNNTREGSPDKLPLIQLATVMQVCLVQIGFVLLVQFIHVLISFNNCTYNET